MTSEWLQIRQKTQVSDTFEVGKLYFKTDGYLPDFRDSVIFPYISLYTQAVAYTTYVEVAARRALKNTSKRRLLSLGSLCQATNLHERTDMRGFVGRTAFWYTSASLSISISMYPGDDLGRHLGDTAEKRTAHACNVTILE